MVGSLGGGEGGELREEGGDVFGEGKRSRRRRRCVGDNAGDSMLIGLEGSQVLTKNGEGGRDGWI